jgi:hypothetical protein
MADVLAGLVCFFCVILGVTAIQRYSDSKSEAAYLEEQKKQQKKWVEDYRPSAERALPKATPQA